MGPQGPPGPQGPRGIFILVHFNNKYNNILKLFNDRLNLQQILEQKTITYLK